MKGKLAKAPGFDEVEGFDGSKNGLFDIRTHVDKLGYLYVNLDTYVSTSLYLEFLSQRCLYCRLNISSPNYIKWEEQFGDVDDQPRVKGFDTEKYKYAFSWSFENCALSPSNFHISSNHLFSQANTTGRLSSITQVLLNV